MHPVQKIDIGIAIDTQKFVDTRALFQASSGGGKSYLLRKIIESIGPMLQQIILDPEGEFITLREKFDFILAGKEGDIPLSVKYAETLAHKILETGASAILDLSELKVHDRVSFVGRFIGSMMAAPRSLWHPCMTYLDEAHLFCPENDRAESASAVIDLCCRGRKRGFGVGLATQRIQKLHKDATAECQNKLIGLTAQDIDRARAGKELGFNRAEDVRQLRELKPGEFFAFGPAISNEVVKFKVAPVITTHLQAGSRIIVPPPTPTAIKNILAQLDGIPEEAERELVNREQLQAEVTRLSGELSRATKTGQSSKGDAGAISKACDLVKKQTAQECQTIIKEKDIAIKGLQEQVRKQEQLILRINQLSGSGQLQEVRPENDKTALGLEIGHYPPPGLIKQPASSSKGERPPSSSITGGAMRMLKAAAMFHPNPITKTRMAALSRLSHTSGSFGTYLSTLKRNDLIRGDGKEFEITPDGLQSAGDVDPLPTDPMELVELWCDIVGKESGAARILRTLAGKYPHLLDKAALGGLAGMSHTSGSFGTYLSTLKRNGLISVQSGRIKASDDLMG
jgi:hypothetical protein